MHYVYRLPFFLGAISSITVGLIGYEQKINNQKIYTRMAISMVIFFILGNLLRNVILEINEDIIKKKTESDMDNDKNIIDNEGKGENLDLRIGDMKDDFGDDFSPYSVSEVIKSNIKE